MNLLGLETSCDETSAALVQNGVVSTSIVSSQIQLHSEYGGVVPELASREHLRNLQPLVREVLQRSQLDPNLLDAVAATQGPGLPSALMVGFKAGQAMAYALDKPFLGIHHHEAHLYSAWIDGSPARLKLDQFEPSICLVVSGGHTLLVHVIPGFRHEVIGSTLDDAAGECFDKIAKLIGLPYPGGPAIDRLAEQGNPTAFSFPRPMLKDPSHDFSFSGLKTAARYYLQDHPGILENSSSLRDLCASIQAAIVEVLVAKTVRAAKRMAVKCVTASGGVACNRALRKELASACHRARLALRLAHPAYCTDNAAMIALLADQKIKQGASLPTPFSAEVIPSWPL